MDIVTGVTLGIALVGAVLGILNTWRSFDRDRPKLRVRPTYATPVGVFEERYPNIGFGIEVVNLSSYALIISEVGFRHKGLGSRSAVLQPITVDNKPTPRKLAPRESVSFYMQKPEPRGGRQLTCAYASTACGLTFTGTGPALKELNKHRAQ